MRLSRGLKIGVLLLVVFAAGWWFFEHSRGWKSLPNGGKVCVLALTHGTQHQFRNSAHSLFRGLTDSVRNRSFRPLTSSGAFYTYGNPSQKPETHAFLGFENASYVDLFDVRLVLPDGQFFRGGSGGGSQAVGEFRFEVMPVRARKFKITARPEPNRFGWKHPPLEWELDNPSFLPNPPEWRGEPLPVTRTDGPLTVTIRDIAIDRLRWAAKLNTSIQWQGTPADEWFSVRPEYSDPAGNVSRYCGLLSEPVWKIDCNIVQTDLFPFAEEDVQWIGATPPAADAPSPGTFTMIPLAPEMRASGIAIAAVLSPGVYDLFADGTLRVAASSEKSARKNQPVRDIHTDQNGTFGRFRIEEPSLLMMGQRRPTHPAVLHFRNSAKTPVRMPDPWQPACAGIYPSIYPLPTSSLRFGIAKLAPRRLEFLVNSPQPPAAK